MNSDRVMKGIQQAPHRSLFNALGFTEEERRKPLIGIVSSQSEIIPGHMELDRSAAACRRAGRRAGCQYGPARRRGQAAVGWSL